VKPLELWGGCECTVNRVGDRYFDQTVRTGRQDRLSDLGLFADLGIRALRHPIVWERTAPDDPEVRDFTWTDVQLAEMQRLGLNPIAGLVHHGSGPRYTSLMDDSFAPGLAAHARAVAERYPWINDYTPVNEPLTTARFSGLYGHWYPHHRDDRAWITALLNQIDATRLSMREIRRVNPDARLIQTEDLGFVHATDTMADQARFENERRWLTWDLLCGHVVEDHPMHAWLSGFGFGDRLQAIADDPCPPDVMGVNHYLTSERFLDARLDRYPGMATGGNGRQTYVDVEAVRVCADGALGWAEILRQAWARYGRTIVVTEAHNGSSREEQMRWFLECWRACETVRGEGADIEAVTAWSLLGAYDWPSLLTEDVGKYECGVFDLSNGEPRPTAMCGLLRALARREAPTDAGFALASPGWWRRPDIRYRFEPVRTSATPPAPAPRTEDEAAPLLITGAGPLARTFARHCRFRGLPFVVAGDKTRAAAGHLQPWSAVIGAGDHGATFDPAGWRGARMLSFAHRGGRGGLHTPFGAPFCHDDANGFAVRLLDALHAGERFDAPEDEAMSPAFRPDAVDAALDLLIDGAEGAWDLAGEEELTWFAFARALADHAGLDADLVRATRGEKRVRPAHHFAGRVTLAPLSSAFDRLLEGYRADRPETLLRYAAE
jgi:dTDP-4-dehydrorhamnose reductase